jgi:hypothetical protein
MYKPQRQAKKGFNLEALQARGYYAAGVVNG